MNMFSNKKRRISYLSLLSEDMWHCIYRFLTNNEIIELLCLCRNRSKNKKNIFTSFSITPHDCLMTSFRRYIDHSKTIKITYIYRINAKEIWPFESEEMVFIGCKKDTIPRMSPKVKKIQFFNYNPHYNMENKKVGF